MPTYIPQVLHKFLHPIPSKPQHAPHTWTQPVYGARTQQAVDEDSSTPLNAVDTRKVQSIVGTLLYYARAVDPTILPALNEIAAKQASPTTNTLQKTHRLLDYVATHPLAILRFHASDMVLNLDSDAAYLVQPQARSRGAGYFYLSDIPPQPPAQPNPTHNAPILVDCHTIRQVMASAAEAETNTAFHNAQLAVPIRTMLQDLGHKQPPTPLKTDNTTTLGILNSNIRQKRSKAFDMRFHWLRDRIKQKQFHVYWKPGTDNKADYFTKHHPAAYHLMIRHHYLQSPTSIQHVQGCVAPGIKPDTQAPSQLGINTCCDVNMTSCQPRTTDPTVRPHDTYGGHRTHCASYKHTVPVTTTKPKITS